MKSVIKKKLKEMIKSEFNIEDLTPMFFNDVLNKYGLLSINHYYVTSERRKFVEEDSCNANVLKYRITCGDEEEYEEAIYDIMHNGNNARDISEVAICLAEIVDCDVLSKQQFIKLYNRCKHDAFNNDKLYQEIITAITKIVKRTPAAFESWCSISHGFGEKIGREIWQGKLQPQFLAYGKTSQEIAIEKLAEKLLDVYETSR